MRVMIVVTHLLGTGHLVRALNLARACVDAGHSVTLVSGGMPVVHLDFTGVDMVQLPPLRSDGVDFTRLLTSDGSVASATLRQERIDTLLRVLAKSQPDTLITELFPFGRRNLRDEFAALLSAARGTCPVIAASVRDILAPPSKPSKVTFADDMISSYYDLVLVHSDPDLVPLGVSWPETPVLTPRLAYTGFVAPPAPTVGDARGDTVLVSAGGGPVGQTIFEAAIAAATQLPQMQWKLMVPGDDNHRSALREGAPGNVTIEAPHPDFRHRMARAAVSVSLCGYNTALDVLQTGTPAVFIPFDDGNEVEQGLRASALSALPGIAVLRQSELTAQTLRTAVETTVGVPRDPRHNRMDGAAETVRILERAHAG